eukprot:6468337-Amphidinium_carterae.1
MYAHPGNPSAKQVQSATEANHRNNTLNCKLWEMLGCTHMDEEASHMLRRLRLKAANMQKERTPIKAKDHSMSIQVQLQNSPNVYIVVKLFVTAPPSFSSSRNYWSLLCSPHPIVVCFPNRAPSYCLDLSPIAMQLHSRLLHCARAACDAVSPHKPSR